MKRSRSLKCAWLLCAALLPAFAQAQFTFLTNNGAITITGYSGSDGMVVIPDTTNGYPVVSIGTNAFSSCGSLTSVTIGTNVVSIGDIAFGNCFNLTNVVIPNSVTNIGDYAFADCFSLISVSIPKSASSIGDRAFGDCTSLMAISVDTNNPAYSSLDGVLFNHNGTTLIQCPGGKAGSYIVPDSVTSIESNAFYNCTSLTNVTIGTNVVSIGVEAFAECDSLTNIVIPNNVANIGYGGFYDCFGLTSVMIGNGVTNIGDYVFYQCLRLTRVTIGSGVTRIGDHAFAGCTSLTGITVDADNADYSTLNGILFDKSQTTIVKYPVPTVGSYVIPNSVTKIGVGAFAQCAQLTSVTIGTNVIFIGDWAFSSCPGLTNVTIPNSVTNIGDYAFADCTGLIDVKIGNGVTSIGDNAFFACIGLTSVTIPKSVTGIGDCPFYDCYSLKTISVDTNNPVYCSLDGVLFNHNRTTLIQCPGGKAGSYTVPDSVTSLGYGAFDFCWLLTGVYFQGNAPTPSNDSSMFYAANSVVVYYLPGTSGWTWIFDDRLTAPWLLPYPLILNNSLGFGMRSTGFGFTISWATNLSVVIEACTNLANSNWYPVATNTLNSGTNYFSDPDWTNYLGRFYRIRSP